MVEVSKGRKFVEEMNDKKLEVFEVG